MGLEPGSLKLYMKYFIGIFKNGIKIQYKKCFKQSMKVEIKELWPSEDSKFYNFSMGEENTFYKYISYGYFFSPNCKNNIVFFNFIGHAFEW